MTVFAAVPSGPTRDPLVQTVSGAVRGRMEAGVAVFRGIPYAAAPVGPLRFAAPAPAPGWAGVRPAVSFGPPAPQGGLLTTGSPTGGTGGAGWLTVNVWSPDPTPTPGLPVLVWIHGGAYLIGSAGSPEYDGRRLAAGGVVVVTVNYRLGLEGFAQLPDAVANRGLLDQIAGLRWVQANIAAFGGDPGRVTVFGQSAGGGSVAALLAMPAAAGLFRRAVVQSMQGTYFTAALAADITAACAAHLGVPATAEGLSTIDPYRLPAAAYALADGMDRRREKWGPITYRPIPVSPVVDGDVLPSTPWAALAVAGGSGDVDLLAGHTRDEHRLFDLIDGVLGQVTQAQSETALRTLAPGPDGADRYRDTYPAATAESLYDLVNGDWAFRMPTLHLARAHAGGGRTHVYELTWPAPALGGALGACHGLDVPLVFGNLTVGQTAMLIGDPAPDEAEAVSERMRAAWTSFAATGDPGWPAYDTQSQLVQLFAPEPEVATYPEQRSQQLWAEHDFAALPLIRA